MYAVLLLLFLTIVFVVIATALVHDEEFAKAVAFGVPALLLLLTLVFIVAPIELGYSRVPDIAEAFTKRLEVGVVYQVEAIRYIGGGDEAIILVWTPLNDYRAIRVKVSGPIPVRFTPIDGRPVEVK